MNEGRIEFRSPWGSIHEDADSEELELFESAIDWNGSRVWNFSRFDVSFAFLTVSPRGVSGLAG